MQIKNLNVYFFILALVVASALAFLLVKPFLMAILMAGILAVAFHHQYKFFLKNTRQGKILSALLTILLVLAIIIIPLLSMLGLLANEASNAYQKILSDRDFYQRQVEGAIDLLNNVPFFNLLDLDRIFDQDQLSRSLRDLSQGLLGLIQSVYQNIVKFILLTFVMFFTMFYLLTEGEKLVEKVKYISPLSDKYENILVSRFVSMTRATLKGTIVIGLVQGFLGGVTFAIAGISSPFIWGLVLTIISILPAVGTPIIMIPAGIILLLSGQIWQGVFVLIMSIGLVSTIDNILRPELVGRDTQMHPLLVFFATLGGIISFGLMGFIIGPIIMALFLALWEIYGKEFKKQLNAFNK
jgi:predicted PurR-regulated permease PerM